MIVIADTSPINYLVLIGEVDLLHELYGSVIIPQTVLRELEDKDTPKVVREWVAAYPAWFSVAQPSGGTGDKTLERLGQGERDAILLAEELHAYRVVIDELAGRQMARLRNLEIVGTLGVLEEGSERGLVDLPRAIEQLQQTNFRISQELVKRALERVAERNRRLELDKAIE